MKLKKINYFLFSIICFLILFVKVSAYTTYPSSSGGSINYDYVVNNLGYPDSERLKDPIFYEALFEYAKTYFTSFSSLGTFETYSHIATTYTYRPSQNENRVQIFYSHDGIINRPGYGQNTAQNTFSSNSDTLAITIDNYSRTIKYWIYYDFYGSQYVFQGSNLTQLQNGTIYGYLSNNPGNTYSNSIITNYYTFNVINTAGFFEFEYNPDFLENNVFWQKVCINNQFTRFSVIPNDFDTSQNSEAYGYMLIPGNIHNLTIGLISNDNSIGYVPIPSLMENTMQLYFNNREYMVSLMIPPELGGSNLFPFIYNFLQAYPNYYQYLYGWTMFDVYHGYNHDYDYYYFPVYTLNNSYVTDVIYDTSSGGSHGGGYREHVGQIDSIAEDSCFYIPVDYTLKIWNLNEYGDIDDTLTISGTDYSIKTTVSESDYLDYILDNTYSGYFGYFTYLIKEATAPLSFISVKFSYFFSKLPIPIQYFCISFVVIACILGLIKFLTGGK